MVEITGVEIDWPDHLKWYLTQEWRDKMKEDIATMKEFLRQAGEIADTYGFVLNVEVEVRK